VVKTLIGLYKDTSTAQRVIEALLEAGFSGDDLSLLVKDKRESAAELDVSATESVGFGALVGALVGIGSALVPGIGPLVGGGALAVMLTAGIGAAAGAVTGGITANLLDLGLNEEAAAYYDDGLRWGGVVVSLTTKAEWLEWAQNIMARHDPVRIEEREARWYGSDWPAFGSAFGSTFGSAFGSSQHRILTQPPAESAPKGSEERDSSRVLGGARSYKYNN
jgi:hypothetical protein